MRNNQPRGKDVFWLVPTFSNAENYFHLTTLLKVSLSNWCNCIFSQNMIPSILGVNYPEKSMNHCLGI